MRRGVGLIMLSAVLTGCASQPQRAVYSADSTQPTTRAAGPSVHSGNFQRLWSAAEETAREYGFMLDRQDYRNGVITTTPLISKQFFELWRGDVRTIEDTANASLATYRRTLRFDIAKSGNGIYTATPSVTVERYVQSEQPITSSVYLRNAFRARRGRQPSGSREADRGIYLPQRYWYVTGDDEALEEAVARRVEKKLR